MSNILKRLEEAKQYIADKNYSDLSYDYEVWEEGIHHCLSSEMPFDTSFDEFTCYDEETPEGLEREKLLASDEFQADMFEWLNSCFIIYHQEEIKKLSS